MSRKNTSKKRDNTMKGAIIAFLVFVVAVGTALAINAHSLSFIGTIDGQRVPMEHFHFQHYMVRDSLGENLWFMDERTTAEIAFESLVEFYNAAARADELGIYLSSDDISSARELADGLREEFIAIYGSDQISLMGFSRSGFYSFVEKITLAGLVSLHIQNSVEFSEEEIQAAFNEHLEEHADNFLIPYVFVAEVETIEEAMEMHRQIHQLNYSILPFVAQSRGYEGDPEDMESRPFYEYSISEEIWNFAIMMHPGMVSEIEPGFGGGYFMFMIDEHVEELPSIEDFENWYTEMRGSELARNYADVWMNQTSIEQNTRVFNRFPSFDMPAFDMGDIEFELDTDDITE